MFMHKCILNVSIIRNKALPFKSWAVKHNQNCSFFPKFSEIPGIAVTILMSPATNVRTIPVPEQTL